MAEPTQLLTLLDVLKLKLIFTGQIGTIPVALDQQHPTVTEG